MKLEAIFKIRGLKNGLVAPGSVFEVDEAQGARLLASGAAKVPGSDTDPSLVKDRGPKVSVESVEPAATESIESIAPPAEAEKPKTKRSKKNTVADLGIDDGSDGIDE